MVRKRAPKITKMQPKEFFMRYRYIHTTDFCPFFMDDFHGCSLFPVPHHSYCHLQIAVMED